MKIYRGIAKVLQIESDTIVIDIGNNETIILNTRNVPDFVKVGDLIQHCEHGFYDIVDEEGNIIFKNY
jgi:hypothetical protein